LPLFQGFFLLAISLDLTPANNAILGKSGCYANRSFQKARVCAGSGRRMNARFYDIAGFISAKQSKRIEAIKYYGHHPK